MEHRGKHISMEAIDLEAIEEEYIGHTPPGPAPAIPRM